MIVGFDAKRAFCNNSGLGVYSRNIINALSDFFPIDRYVLFTPQKKTKYAEVLMKPNISFVAPKYKGSLYKPLWRSFVLGNVIDKFNVDVFHGLSSELPFTINSANVKKIVTVHDVVFMRHPELYSLLDREMYRAKTDFAIYHSDRIIAVSEQTKRDIMEFFKVPDGKISVVYQPCNPIYSTPVKKEQLDEVKIKYGLADDFILSVGNIEERKNVFSVIRALCLHNLDIPFVIVGKKTDYLNLLVQYVKTHKMSNVMFLHNVPTCDLKMMYHLAVASVYPSMYEGFGIPIIESLSCGTPVITNKEGCFTEAAGPGGYYVDVNDIDAVADAIVTITSDSSLRASLSAEGKKYIDRFDRKVIADALMAVYG
ncbi:MAG: glycosyltransferase family 1 protein [Bacteroidales bacterium]|nr:glycosyltransferase family 1 protein [Bacteroidales bacterium]